MSEAPETRRVAVFAVTAVVALVGTWWLAKGLLATDAAYFHIERADIFLMSAFEHLFVRYDVPAAGVVAAVLAVAALAGTALPRKVWEWPVRQVSENQAVVAVLAALALAVLAPVVYRNYPLALDEYAPFFQSEIFAAGHLRGHYPPDLASDLVPGGNDFITTSKDGYAIEGNWPTFAMLLAPFTRAGVPWLLNPLVAGAILIVLGYLARKLMPEQPLAAGWATILCLASPVFTADAVSFYTMNLHLLVALSYAALFLELTPVRMVAAGLVGTIGLSLNNPFPHMLYALPWIVWLLVRRERWGKLLWLALGYLPIIPLGLWWLGVQSLARPPEGPSGQPAKHETLVQRIHDEISNGAFHLPTLAMLHDRAIWASKLYLWAVPGLVVIAFWGYRWVRDSPVARLQVWSAAATLAGYTVVKWDQGHGWGARYLQPVWGVLPLFGAVWLTRDPASERWRGLFACLAAGGLLVMTPERFVQMREFITQAIEQAPPADPDRRQVIFVYGFREREPDPNRELPFHGRFYAWDAIRNDPFLRGPTVKLYSYGPTRDRALVARRYPGAREVSSGVHGTVWDLP